MEMGPLSVSFVSPPPRDVSSLKVNGESESHSIVSDSLQVHGIYSPRNSPGQNTGVGGLSLPQGILPTQGSNQGLLHCRQIFYQMSYQGPALIYDYMWDYRINTALI